MTTVRMYLSRSGLLLVLQQVVEIRSIRVIRKAGVFVTDLVGTPALKAAEELEGIPGAVLPNPDETTE